ncbi:group 1 glycosyl transferase [Fictibacillus macauensis ZFHKF-1]|uniref:Group 1 glycosyl transferase n=1 Tax=Fictibacillus macauensis ZFHKF-1 TaxID=1196324 RepID=I8AML4_9BACL|nr:glycosyltransferase family 4 protein [Fictibacillus macauensis]EIT86924.1 group 1 glycosyl transferase [Fictibacillus macauensis ZFHKF-1]
MKICHLTSVHPATDIRIFLKECQSLHQHGHDVYLIAPHTESVVMNGIQIKQVGPFRGARLVKMIRAVKAVYTKALEVDADVYHFHDPELIIVGLLLKRRGKHVIYDVHEDVPQQILSKQWLPKSLRKSVSWIAERIEGYGARRLDAIVTATPFLAQRFKAFSSRVVTLHNYPMLHELATITSLQEEEPLPAFVYIGGLSELRGVRAMLAAMTALNSEKAKAHLMWAGTFSPPSLEEEVAPQLATAGIDYYGYLSREEVKHALSRAVAGLVLLQPEPRYTVSYPIKLFEYMAAGIPTIASDFPLWRTFVEEPSCGICVNPLDEEAIAKALLWIIEHPQQARQMGENGKRAVLAHYNWEKESEKLISLYETIKGTERKRGEGADEDLDLESCSVKAF